MTGGLLLYASRALACLPGPRDCIMTEDEVIRQHKERTGAEIFIRRGRKRREAGGTRGRSRSAQSSAVNSTCVRPQRTLHRNHLRRRGVPEKMELTVMTSALARPRFTPGWGAADCDGGGGFRAHATGVSMEYKVGAKEAESQSANIGRSPPTMRRGAARPRPRQR